MVRRRPEVHNGGAWARGPPPGLVAAPRVVAFGGAPPRFPLGWPPPGSLTPGPPAILPPPMAPPVVAPPLPQVSLPPAPPSPIPAGVFSAQAPQFLGHRSWERDLADALGQEEQKRALSWSKHGVSLQVFRRGRAEAPEEGGEAGGSSSSVSDEWSDDPWLPVDLGVVTVENPDNVGGGHYDEEEEEEEEEVVPEGYEDAPPVVLRALPPVQEPSSISPEGALLLSGSEGEAEGEGGPSVARQFIKIHNTSPFPVALSEVLILPKDRPGSRVWVEVTAGGMQYSSRQDEGPRRIVDPHDHHQQREAGGGGPLVSQAAGPQLVVAAQRGRGSVQVRLFAEQDAELGCVAKWVLLRFERPSVGCAFDHVTHQFLVARRVVGVVVDPTAKSMLNIEARPFVPRELLEWFDKPALVLKMDVAKYRPRRINDLLELLLLPDDTCQRREAFQARLQVYKELPPDRQNPHSFFAVPPAGSGPWDAANMVRVQQTLLLLEEAQAEADIRHYDLYHVSLRIDASQALRGVWTTTIKVPGVSEQRPHLAYGDVVRLRPSKPVAPFDPDVGSSSEGTAPRPPQQQQSEVVAMVLRTVEDRVTLRLPPGTPVETFPSTRFHCRFHHNRTDFRVLHHALDSLPTHTGTLLFPAADDAAIRDGEEEGPVVEEEMPAPDFVHSMINQEQRQAVTDITFTACSHALPPYIIFGPPGTGKTLTVIEAIIQVCRRGQQQQQQSSSSQPVRVLACAPSDTAADILCDRLANHLSKNQLFRLNWWQRKLESLPPRLLNYSCLDAEASVFTLPQGGTSALHKFQVIVSTCASAGLLSLQLQADRRRGGQEAAWSLSHIFIDESSQAQLPEVLVPLALASPTTRVVLSGDPKQLGPLVRSSLASSLGLGRSLQEHLMTLPSATALYSSSDSEAGDGQQPRRRRCITTLRRNYRSHKAIIEVPSRLFYDQKLVECADRSVTASMLGWELLEPVVDDRQHHARRPVEAAGGLGSRCPVMFWGVVGEDLHELDSPSFFNPVEAAKIADLLKSLLTSRTVQCSTGDVGVISAFRKQVLKLRSLLRRQGLGAVNCGQVEDFQGQEQKVIIISTVLSTRHPRDIQQHLGFLGHPKRFNVAVTRAKALTVIVGNPFVLLEDPCWRALLEFCVHNNAYRGCRCPLLGVQSEDDLDAVLDAVASLSLLGRGHRPTVATPDALDNFVDSGFRVML